MVFRTHRIAGVDGCRSGWIAVEAQCDLSKAELMFAPNWHDLKSTARIVAVDMPIGLSINGVRQCEVEARKLIAPHGSRVFKTLPRESLKFAQDKWNDANQWSKSQGHGGISKQIWNIRPKIKELDRALAPGDQRRVHESHPELAFARLNGGRPLESKHSATGLAVRKRLLQRAGFTKLDDWLQGLSRNGAKADDLYDACVLVLTARNILRGEARVVPAVPQTDSRGLTMSIAY